MVACTRFRKPERRRGPGRLKVGPDLLRLVREGFLEGVNCKVRGKGLRTSGPNSGIQKARLCVWGLGFSSVLGIEPRASYTLRRHFYR